MNCKTYISNYIILHVSCLLIVCLLLSACSEEKTQEPATHEGDLTVRLHADTWTYVSLEADSVVAEIAFADSVAQQAMARRTDWDLAYAPGGLMRTNSAPSGTAQKLQLKLAAPDSSQQEDAASAIARQLQAIGIDIDLRILSDQA